MAAVSEVSGAAEEAAPARPRRTPPKAASLCYVSDAEPGIRRAVAGTGFRYRGPDGRRITDKAMLQRIRKLAVPPAWKDVWICPTADGHIQATGRDDRRRKQYCYHPDWREFRDREKFAHILDFARLLPRIRERVRQDMSARAITREKVLATIVALLDNTLIRVGNDEYAKANGSFGLTTLRNHHLALEGSELRFSFKAKSGKVWRLRVRDRRIARVMRSLQDLPGQHLFQYVDEAGAVHSVGSSDVNDYLREIAGAEVSAKDFRTWSGTVLAVAALSALDAFASTMEAKRNLRAVVAEVAARLGNTPTICRKFYVHPAIVDCYLEGVLPKGPRRDASREQGLLQPDEELTLCVLKARLAASAKTA